jgi:transcriptional regulator with XRE-family HTH domain
MDPNPSTDEPDGAALAYNRRVGALLRLARKHRGLSLQEVEARTGQEFKASVLGAYERGERAMSLPRLGRLAEFYGIEAGHLLPGSAGPSPFGADPALRPTFLTVDAEKLIGFDGELQALARFVDSVRRQRGDPSARYVVLRDADRQAVAAIVGVPVDELDARLELLEVLAR